MIILAIQFIVLVLFIVGMVYRLSMHSNRNNRATVRNTARNVAIIDVVSMVLMAFLVVAGASSLSAFLLIALITWYNYSSTEFGSIAIDEISDIIAGLRTSFKRATA